MDNSWRASLAARFSSENCKRIMDTLQRHMPVAGQDGVDELLKIAWRFEEKIFQAATDQQDYLRKISLKMLSLETKANGNPLQARHPPGAQGAAQAATRPVDQAALAMRNAAQTLNNGSQLGSQAQQLQQQQLQQQQRQQQLLAQSLQANGAGGIQAPATGLGSNLSTMAGVPQNPMAAMGGQMNPTMMNNRLQQMQQQQQRQAASATASSAAAATTAAAAAAAAAAATAE
ncbi:hypothetical protein M758_1G055400 [Ceratodon purpureus]|nr:hypothetical protein M758_1G055400 [Ceratodon purpureus]